MITSFKSLFSLLHGILVNEQNCLELILSLVQWPYYQCK